MRRSHGHTSINHQNHLKQTRETQQYILLWCVSCCPQAATLISTGVGGHVKEFEVEVKLRNNLLKERRKALGMNQEEFAEAAGVNLTRYRNLECLRESPLKPLDAYFKSCIAPGCNSETARPPLRHRRLCPTHYKQQPTKKQWDVWLKSFKETCPKTWRTIALQLAAFHNVEPSELWPAAVLLVRKGRAIRKLAAAEVGALLPSSEPLALPPASEDYDAAELRDRVARVLTTLSPHEEDIIRQRFFDDKTLEEIGGEYHHREQIRQIEAKALRKLRQPSRADYLKPWVFVDALDPIHPPGTELEITRWCPVCLAAFTGTKSGPLVCLNCTVKKTCPRCSRHLVVSKKSAVCASCGWKASI